MTDDSMIERVARAIVLASEWDWRPGKFSVEGLSLVLARGAIAAMREPTEGMMRAADNEAAMDIWHDMIEAALEE